MAWTTPATYATNEVLASSKLNTHVRDNLRYLRGLDGVVTLEDDLHLSSANASIEIGTPGAANTPFIDFHSSASDTDFDVRIIATGGTASAGAGNLGVTAGTIALSAATLTTVAGPTTFGDAITVTAGASNNGGAWYASAGGTQRAFAGLEASSTTIWRLYSAAFPGNILSADLPSGTITLATKLTTPEVGATGVLLLTSASGITFQPVDGTDFFTMVNAADGFRPTSDNVVSCGRAANRFSVVYAGTGAINTCSREVKEVTGVMDDDLALAHLLDLPAVYRFHYKHPKALGPGVWADGVGGRPLELEADTTREFIGPVSEEMADDLRVGPTEAGNVNTEGCLIAAVRALGKRLAAAEGRLAALGAGPTAAPAGEGG